MCELVLLLYKCGCVRHVYSCHGPQCIGSTEALQQRHYPDQNCDQCAQRIMDETTKLAGIFDEFQARNPGVQVQRPIFAQGVWMPSNTGASTAVDIQATYTKASLNGASSGLIVAPSDNTKNKAIAARMLASLIRNTLQSQEQFRQLQHKTYCKATDKLIKEAIAGSTDFEKLKSWSHMYHACSPGSQQSI